MGGRGRSSVASWRGIRCREEKGTGRDALRCFESAMMRIAKLLQVSPSGLRRTRRRQRSRAPRWYTKSVVLTLRYASAGRRKVFETGGEQGTALPFTFHRPSIGCRRADSTQTPPWRTGC